MQKAAEKPAEKMPELVPLNVIRVETALSRYPMHRLAKHGSIAIEIREASEDGEVLIRWEVTPNAKFGQPGPLAYKVDTLIVNRRIEEASRPIPRLIKLGSLKDICRELGLAENGKNTNDIRKALSQNALAGITAKIKYKFPDGAERTLEAVFTRYGVVFTGEKLSDGRTADAVYLEFSDRFMQVINGAQTRPLDYDYLRDLPPAAQRLYELLSFQMYAALKYSRRQARLAYSEFCTCAPLTRHFEWFRVRNQMNKIHRPHLKSGYIERVGFEQTADRDGNPDWLMVYVPGFKAKAEYRAFTKRGGPKVLEIETTPVTPEPELKAAAKSDPPPLELELINRGVTASTARELIAAYPEEQIRRQVDHADFLVETKTRGISNRGAYLAKAIREDFAPPPGFEPKADREKRREAEEERKRQEAAANRRRHEQKAREDEAQAKVTDYLKGLSPEELSRLDAEVIEQADPEMRESYARQNPRFRGMFLRSIREMHIRKLLGVASPDAPAQ